MNFNDYSRLKGKHAFLSASKYHWINYDMQKLADVFSRSQAAAIGTRIHEVASELIELGIKLPRSNKTLNRYVNDAIGYKMQTEQVLYYSDNAFGTADAISFKNNMLRVHDLKTGVSPTSVTQLEIYAAFFCLEYGFSPNDIDIELRIYQMDEVIVHDPERTTILEIMSLIVDFDKKITSMLTEILV